MYLCVHLGFKGLFRGVEGAMLRVAVGSAVQLSTYDTCKQIVHNTGYIQDGVGAHLWYHSCTYIHTYSYLCLPQIHKYIICISASLLAGLAVTTAMNPFDVVSTRLYNQKLNPKTGKVYYILDLLIV